MKFLALPSTLLPRGRSWRPWTPRWGGYGSRRMAHRSSNNLPPIPGPQLHALGIGYTMDKLATRTPANPKWRRRLPHGRGFQSRTESNVAFVARSAIAFLTPILAAAPVTETSHDVIMTMPPTTREIGRDRDGHHAKKEPRKRGDLLQCRPSPDLGIGKFSSWNQKTEFLVAEGPNPPIRGLWPRNPPFAPTLPRELYAPRGGGGGPSSQALPA